MIESEKSTASLLIAQPSWIVFVVTVFLHQEFPMNREVTDV